MTGLRGFRCPSCGPSLLVRLGNDETQVRCLRCRGTPIHLSVIAAIREFAFPLAGRAACELSSRGALVRFLQRHAGSLATSEYFDDVPPGGLRDGVRCEDVQALGYADASFDLFTSTEVFEHVPDDAAGFREIRRTLKPGGLTIFTVPLIRGASTVERARLRDGGIEHLLEPAWHGDRLRGAGKVLVFRDYGDDIVERLLAAGFARARLWRPPVDWFGHARDVVVAHA
ncbi:MAG TPA: class I SAM-dependent methyltransferase [Arenimonas sp.]|jgi:SAM-dependent methyltransferase|nr:class I SAM-dependent methyltransferase [Arenimonas sp.]